MKVGILTEPIDRKWGSVAIFTEKLVNNLKKLQRKKYTSTEIVLIHFFTNDHPIYKDTDEIIAFPHTKKRWGELNLFQKATFHFKFYSKLPIIAEKNNIDVLHLPQFVAGFSPPLTFRKLGDTRIIITLHGVQPLIIPPTKYPYFRYQFLQEGIYSYFGAAKWKAKFKEMVDRIVTVSYSEKKNIVRALGISPDKISVVYHGAPENICTQLSKTQAFYYLSKKYGISKPFILHVSNQHPVKNTVRLINAFNQLNLENHQLVIVGKSKITPLLEKYVKHKNMNNITFIGHVPFRYMPIFYKAAEIFVLPSLRESFGMPVIEAMACGTPVITSNIYATREIAHGAAYLVNPYNNDEISSAISILLSDSTLRRKLSKRGIKQAKKFSWKKTAESYLRIYKEVHES